MSTATAPILDRSAGRIQFRVDDVPQASDALATAALGPGLEALLGGPLLACSHPADTELVAVGDLEQFFSPGQIHPLVAAVHLAYSQHRPLTLSPDAIWLTIAQGFAQHINLQHTEMRDRLVRHQGQHPLLVATHGLQGPDDWAALIAGWADLLADEVGAGLARALVCDFSTTTPAARTASQIVLMDALRRYFDYRAMHICGIPLLTLRGTPDDWRRIRERIEVLAEYDLEWWVARLRPIADGLLASAEGRPELAFWQQIYCPREAYGGDVVTGWIADLFPYVNDATSRTPTRQNRLLTIPLAERRARDGLSPDSFPTGLAQVWCQLSDAVTDTTRRALLAGGLIGVRQYMSGALSPEIGWAVCGADPFTALIDRLAEIAPRAELIDWTAIRAIPELPGEALQLIDTFRGQTWYAGSGHSWRVREPEALAQHALPQSYGRVTLFLDLADGRAIGTYEHSETSGSWEDGTFQRRYETRVVVGRPASQIDRWGREEAVLGPDTQVIALGVAQLIERLLAADGRYYFDAPDFTPDTPIVADRA